VHLRVVNPNTTASMTATIELAARSAASPGTVVSAATPSMGPASIESHYDEALAVPGVLAEIAGGNDTVDAWVLACFGDPGLDAARELARGPVVGIAEAAMRTAGYLGRGFSVVTTLGRTRGRAWDLAEHYGLGRRCLAVRACEIAVLDLDAPGSDARGRVAQECARAVAEDGCDAIVLGCAGMAEFCAELTARVGVPVVDGVAAGVRAAESLVALGLSTGRRGEFAAPPPKPCTGVLAPFGLPEAP
jgi:allantoin racemase